jgi:hypothetical protein
MLKRLLSAVLAALLLQTFANGTAYAGSQDDNNKQARRVERIRKAVGRVGVGEKARVYVKLSDKSTLEGYVREAGADSFVVVDKKTGVGVVVAYGDVERLRGLNISTGTKIAYGFAVGAAFLGALTLFAIIVGPHLPD